MTTRDELTPAGLEVLRELRRRGLTKTDVDRVDRRPLARLERLGLVSFYSETKRARTVGGRPRIVDYVELTPAGYAELERVEGNP